MSVEHDDRIPRDMYLALHASHNGNLFKVNVLGIGDIADLIREHHLESLTSRDGGIDFWLTPSLEPYHRSVNRMATEMLLAASRFNARNVPLLRGNVVMAGHDNNGALAGLTDDQISWLVNSEPSRRDEWVLARRFAGDERRQRRETRGGSRGSLFSHLGMKPPAF
jgi:hypothetical protein